MTTPGQDAQACPTCDTDPNTQWCDAARASLAALRETHNVTARAEQ